MKRQSTILAGTAVGLLMASAGAFALGTARLPGPAAAPPAARVMVIPAQAECQEAESAEACTSAAV